MKLTVERFEVYFFMFLNPIRIALVYVFDSYSHSVQVLGAIWSLGKSLHHTVLPPTDKVAVHIDDWP